MFIVYKLIFINRLEAKTPPYYYIGSKANCKVVEGKIIDRRGKPYYGSCKWKHYNEIVKNSEIAVDILSRHNNIETCLLAERKQHLDAKVLTDIEYFNRAVTGKSNFTDPNYAVFKHHILEHKIIRLKRNDPLVKNGTYVGITRGTVFTEEQNKKRGLPGESNPFYGKKHSKKIQKQISDSLRKYYEGNTEARKVISERSTRLFKGVKKTEEHKAKIGRIGLFMIRHIETGEHKRVSKKDFNKFDKKYWVRSFVGLNAANKIGKCVHCGLEANLGNIARFHDEKCKNKIN